MLWQAEYEMLSYNTGSFDNYQAEAIIAPTLQSGELVHRDWNSLPKVKQVAKGRTWICIQIVWLWRLLTNIVQTH